jgi:two-component system CheB/CheR fusion protein
MHLSPEHPSRLADILGKSTSMKVEQVQGDTTVQPNTVYVIPPGHYLILSGELLRLEKMVQPRSLPKAIDRLFISLAEEQQEKAICIVLTGADHDGTVGLKAIKAGGGLVIAQRPETAQHPSMPESAIDTGLVDYILSLEEMGAALMQYIGRSTLWQFERLPKPTEEEAQILEQIISFVRTRGGGDFRGYKEGMLMRRTKRRMALHGKDTLEAYLAYLHENPSEVPALSADFRIKVTEFFREAQAWQALEHEVLPKIIESIASGESLRVWVAGCATGEEAYSIGISLLELISKRELQVKLNIIASDIDRSALEVARAGSYSESIVTVLKRDLLVRYFTRGEDGRFVVRKGLREAIMFSEHNLLADPPFSHMHLISCRNLLIYLKPEVQDKLLKMFHFALNPDGYLFLGKSETAGENGELYRSIDKENRIYQCLPSERKIPVKLPLVPDTSVTRFALFTGERSKFRSFYHELVRELLLKQRSATGVLIDKNCQVLYFYGPTREFLWQPEGVATRDIFEMATDEMRTALRAVIHSAREEGKTTEMVLPLRQDEARQLRIRAINADGSESEGLVLVTFEYEASGAARNKPANDAESWARKHLEDELRITRLNLETSVHALEKNNVELRIANEEALSANEELQSSNEELETTKEELQSLNEELNTVNSDLERTVHELKAINDDLQNLLASSDLAILFLDQELCIKRFTPASRKLFRLIPADIGRPIADFASTLEPPDLIAVARKVQATRTGYETEVRAPQGNFYLRRILPYVVEEDRVEGVVVTFAPIDTLKRAEQELRDSEKRFRTLADTAPVFIWISGLGGELEFVNRRFIDETRQSAENLLGTGWQSLVHAEDLKIYQDARAVAEADGKGYQCELRLRKPDGSYGWMRFVGEPRLEGGKVTGFVGSSVDIQYHKQAEEQLRSADRRKDEFLAILGHELRNPLSPIRNAAQALQFVHSDDSRLSWARETIIRQVNHMTRLVDDLLDVARLTRGTLTLRKEIVDIASVAHHAVDAVRALIDARRHNLVVSIRDEPLFVNGDPVRLSQIIENLLSNAAKFTDEGGKISLDIHREGRELILSVEDNGMGIPERLLTRIFGLFMQEERLARKSNTGLGIGLALVSQLVSLHGGSVAASSRGPGHGSRFVVRLPLIDIAAQPMKETEALPSDAKGRIIIVDDNADSADTMAMLMGMYGYEVRVAYDLDSAIKEGMAFAPHIALLDLSRPEPDGMELAKRFQEMPQTKNAILIAFSGYGQPEDIERSKQAGFVEHLVKPVDPASVHKLISSLMEANRQPKAG